MDKATAKAQLDRLNVKVSEKDIISIISMPDENYPHNEFTSCVFHRKVLMADGSAHEYDEIWADSHGQPSPVSGKHIFANYNYMSGGKSE